LRFDFLMPSEVLSGEDIVKKAKIFGGLGRRCVIITGKNSAKASGALDDIRAALDGESVSYSVFDGIMQNPLVSVCREAGLFARGQGADFLIAAGGGSVLDAAKAAAIFALNDLSDDALFAFKTGKVLPYVAVGTTAGTGSEVTKIAVLTQDENGEKRSINAKCLYPKFTLCDPKYTYSLSYDFTVSTALDALSHAVEGYFCSLANDLTDLHALKAVSLIAPALGRLSGEIQKPVRDDLFYGSLFAGLTLNTCGTGFPHPMGYVLTKTFSVPHGKACAVFLPEYIRLGLLACPEKGAPLFAAAGMSQKELEALIQRLLNLPEIVFSMALKARCFARFADMKNFAISPGGFTNAQALALYDRLFG